jgi:hypothetical protein
MSLTINSFNGIVRLPRHHDRSGRDDRADVSTRSWERTSILQVSPNQIDASLPKTFDSLSISRWSHHRTRWSSRSPQQSTDLGLLDWEWLREQEYSLRASALADDSCCNRSTFFQSRMLARRRCKPGNSHRQITRRLKQARRARGEEQERDETAS